ncbi:MAG: filamentous hemagglutinin N-terminal domain-containing protein [Oscillatoria princeps RMCB-10]|jgi:filamentous hemagglutinin family protein|nr:filamentous hemagglutinin N-terminal domain-containing protein [Oscillatoria princeps RMCB-10]
MKPFSHVRLPLLSLATLSLLAPSPSGAQVVPDATLPNNSTVSQQGSALKIEGGTSAGGNLFHSFREFSLPKGTEAHFNSAPAIENIFTRVTGGKISNIDGTLRANGGANLFLLNPNGIIFGPNAKLNIGGSFFASTGERLNLADGSVFSAKDTAAKPVLTVSVPIGLQLGANPGRIVNQSVAADTSGKTVGLSVQPGKTLALVGGEVSLAGGYVTGAGGRIELAGVGGNSSVSISATGSGLALGYESVSDFRNVELKGGAMVDASGEPSSAVQVRGRTVQVMSGARIYALNSGAQAGGDININASQSVEAIGRGNLAKDTVTINETDFSNPLELPTGLFSVTSGAGASGNVGINAPRLSERNSAVIGTYTSGAGRGGDVTVSAPESVEISASRLETYTVLDSPGASGNLTVNTGRFSVKDVGVVSASTNGAGQGGNLTVNASDSINVLGTNILVIERADGVPLFASTVLFTATAGAGNAGEMRLTTGRLIARDGAAIAPNSSGAGRPGNAIITATESVELSGKTRDAFAFPTTLLAATTPFATGTGGGNVTISTGKLIVRDGAVITMSNLSPGSGGSLEVIADSILLDNKASIGAETAFGEGGNITLRSRSLQLRNSSTISVTAGSTQNPFGLPPDLAAVYAAQVTGAGDGGNIIINTDTLAALEKSTIAANAQEGRGGRVSITAQGIFLSRDSAITATSALGAEFSGVVEIQTPNTDLKSGLVELAQHPLDPNQRVAAGCAADRGNTFTVTGRGGLPEDPTSELLGRTVWWDSRDLSAIGNQASLPARELPEAADAKTLGGESKISAAPPLQEATGWAIRPDGEVELVANLPDSSNPWHPTPDCRALPQQ